MAKLEVDTLIRRMATSPEADPVRRVIIEFERDPELVGTAVLHLVGVYFDQMLSVRDVMTRLVGT